MGCYETEMTQQAGALRSFAAEKMPPAVQRVRPREHQRIIVTGMGSSHFAGLPTWRVLVSQGHLAWWTSAAQLLDTPELIAPGSLVIMTSQSGRTGEVVELLQQIRSRHTTTVIGITNDLGSPLAAEATSVVALRSGTEHAVSTKSYLNSLAAHQRLLSAIRGSSDEECVRDILNTADAVENWSAPDSLREAAAKAGATTPVSVALVGDGDDATTALWGGLVLKEAVHLPAEGYVGGEFRHGPIEIARSGLLAVLLSSSASRYPSSSRRLAADLEAAKSTVVSVSDEAGSGHHVRLPRTTTLARLALGARVVQQLAIELARLQDLEPGTINVGDKTTTVL